MIDPKRREMFVDLYRMAEYYEQPPFRPGDVDWNVSWFKKANQETLLPFLKKYDQNRMAVSIAMAILDDASRKAADANKGDA